MYFEHEVEMVVSCKVACLAGVEADVRGVGPGYVQDSIFGDSVHWLIKLQIRSRNTLIRLSDCNMILLVAID